MATCEHTPPPRPPSGGRIDGHAWVVNRRKDLIGLLCGPAERLPGTISASASVWLPPDEAERRPVRPCWQPLRHGGAHKATNGEGVRYPQHKIHTEDLCTWVGVLAALKDRAGRAERGADEAADRVGYAVRRGGAR